MALRRRWTHTIQKNEHVSKCHLMRLFELYVRRVGTNASLLVGASNYFTIQKAEKYLMYCNISTVYPTYFIVILGGLVLLISIVFTDSVPYGICSLTSKTQGVRNKKN